MVWKIYFWFITLTMIAGTGLSIAESLGILLLEEGDPLLDDAWNWLEWLNILITWICLSGLFGFAYKKVIGEQDFWKKWFVFTLIFDTAYAVYVDYPEGFITENVLLDILGYSFSIPFYIALFLYGYKSDSLWKPQPTPPQ